MGSFIVSALTNQAQSIAESAPALKKYQEVVAVPSSLSLCQYGALFAMVLEFKPDLILEFGRSAGNSTCAFAEGVHRLEKKAQIASYCMDDAWRTRTLPRLKELSLPQSWFTPINAKVADITTVDYASIVAGFDRVFCFWDAFTDDIADVLFGKLMPLIADRPHMIAVHDISDNRYLTSGRDYQGKSLWRGCDDFYANRERTAYQNVFWLNFVNDQALPLLDFCWRNGIELHSVDHEVHEGLFNHASSAAKLDDVIPHDFLRNLFHLTYFTLNEGSGPFTFPAIIPKRRPSKTILQRLRSILRTVYR